MIALFHGKWIHKLKHYRAGQFLHAFGTVLGQVHKLEAPATGGSTPSIPHGLDWKVLFWDVLLWSTFWPLACVQITPFIPSHGLCCSDSVQTSKKSWRAWMLLPLECPAPSSTGKWAWCVLGEDKGRDHSQLRKSVTMWKIQSETNPGTFSFLPKLQHKTGVDWIQTQQGLSSGSILSSRYASIYPELW